MLIMLGVFFQTKSVMLLKDIGFVAIISFEFVPTTYTLNNHMGKGSRSQKLCLGILKDLIKRIKRMKTSSKNIIWVCSYYII